MGNTASDKRNARCYSLKFSKNTDSDILEKLDNVDSIQGYIKSLIRADIMKEGKTMKYCVEYTDSRNGATSPIDNIEAKAGYTAEDYIRDCKANADDEWNEMLSQGSVELVPVETAYHIKPEYIDLWGSEAYEDTIVTQDEVERLADEWGKPVDELLEQLTEI